MRRALMLGVVGLVLAGCGGDGGKTEDLREFLRQAHEFDSRYESLGEVIYEDGDVRVDSTLKVNAELDQQNSSYEFCEWVSDWLYEGDNGTADSQVILSASGTHVFTRRGLSESCQEASFNSQYSP